MPTFIFSQINDLKAAVNKVISSARSVELDNRSLVKKARKRASMRGAGGAAKDAESDSSVTTDEESMDTDEEVRVLDAAAKDVANERKTITLTMGFDEVCSFVLLSSPPS